MTTPWRRLAWAGALAVTACTKSIPGPLEPLPEAPGLIVIAAPRVNGSAGAPKATPPAQLSYGTPFAGEAAGAAGTNGAGDISLDFADTDIREVVDQILGHILQVNYTIDPTVHGSATFKTRQKLLRAQLLPTLRILLSENGAVLEQTDGLYRVLPNAAGTGPNGAVLLPLHYTSAEALQKVLQPFIGANAKLAADPGRNALIASGDATTTAAVADLVRSFDIDQLAGQSYALLPVSAGTAKDFSTALQDAFRTQNGGALAGLVHVVPMDHVDAVLVISSEPRYLADARRIYALVQRNADQTVRSWHVYYLQNSHADDIAYVLQQAFTPNNVTAQPTQSANTGNGMQTVNGLGAGQSGMNGSAGSAPGSAPTGSTPGSATGTLTSGTATPLPGGGQRALAGSATSNPLLGGLDQSGQGNDADAMRIIPNEQNNAVIVYATPHEEATVEAMLHKIDIMPLQVRIDATIAEVQLNDALQYGTQFFFQSGGINGMLNNSMQTVTGALASAPFAANFPGFVIGGHGAGGAPFAISALQAVTTVKVLSSPEIMVLDNQPAKLQVGNLVPYLTGTAQSVLTSDAAIVSTINYRETGVIMQVTPRVNSGGQVTLDIAQEVSGIDTSAPTTSGITSPTFSERSITSRVVVQDGETVGLAGLINDSVTRGNQGIPWLKDIPVLGLLAGAQNNQRVRTELLVMITPHVIHDERDARGLTQDMRRQMPNAALVPQDVRALGASGSDDPGRPLRRRADPTQ